MNGRRSGLVSNLLSKAKKNKEGRPERDAPILTFSMFASLQTQDSVELAAVVPFVIEFESNALHALQESWLPNVKPPAPSLVATGIK
jgi:hypothetical protein